MPQLNNAEIIARDLRYYLPTFKRYPIALRQGRGCHVWDADGNSYLDAIAGLAVNNLGHCHPAIVSAIQKQAEKLIHISNFYTSAPQALLAEELCEASGMYSAFFTNSGVESVEAAIKLARKYAHGKNKGGVVIAMEGAFHGRTLATLAMGKEKLRKGFEPIPEGFKVVPWQDMQAVQNNVTNETAAVIIEPVQGEGGVHPVDRNFLKALRQFCNTQDILLIFDEIQCGMGRTGHLFAKDHYDVQPDIMTLAKGLGGGVPIGAVLANEKVTNVIEYGDHGTTFGGNPLVCAAARAALKELRDPALLEDVNKKSEYLQKEITGRKHPHIRELRILGLMVGIEFDFPVASLVEKMMELGVLANGTSDTVLRLLPPLIISKNELERVVNTMFQALEEIDQNG